MIPEARQIWSGLEFRKPMLLRNVEPLDESQLRWIPGPGRVSVAWQVWHIAEVEDNWIRSIVTDEPLRFPFGVQVREASDAQYPGKEELIAYLHDVRELTKQRLAAATENEFERAVEDPDFGMCAVRDIWAGVVTSFAWHAGQAALTAKLIPETPVSTMTFGYWKTPEWSDDSGGAS